MRIKIRQRMGRFNNDYKNFPEIDQVERGPILLVLGGNNSTDLVSSNGYAGIAQNLLGCRNSPDARIQFLSFEYPPHFGQLPREGVVWTPQQLREKLLSEEYYYDAALVSAGARLFGPLITDDFTYDWENGSFEGTPLSPERTAAGLRNLNIMVHCLGGIVEFQLMEVLDDMLKGLGFDDPKQRAFMKRQVLSATAGNQAPAMMGDPASTRVNVLTSGDIIAGMTCVENNLGLATAQLESLLKKYPQLAQKSSIAISVPGKPDEIIIFIRSIDPKQEGPFPDTMPRVERTGLFVNDQDELNLLKDDEFHQDITYFIPGAGDKGMFIPLIFSMVLLNGVNNSLQNQTAKAFVPLPELRELLKVPKIIELAQDSPAESGIYSRRGLLAAARTIGFAERSQGLFLD